MTLLFIFVVDVSWEGSMSGEEIIEKNKKNLILLSPDRTHVQDVSLALP